VINDSGWRARCSKTPHVGIIRDTVRDRKMQWIDFQRATKERDEMKWQRHKMIDGIDCVPCSAVPATGAHTVAYAQPMSGCWRL
jgi:hypothetical protein